MPLIKQQDVIVISRSGLTLTAAVDELHKKLAAYPDVRIVSMSITFASLAMGINLVAVIETV